MLRRSYEASRTRSVGLSVGRSSKQSLVHSKKNKVHESNKLDKWNRLDKSNKLKR